MSFPTTLAICCGKHSAYKGRWQGFSFPIKSHKHSSVFYCHTEAADLFIEYPYSSIPLSSFSECFRTQLHQAAPYSRVVETTNSHLRRILFSQLKTILLLHTVPFFLDLYNKNSSFVYYKITPVIYRRRFFWQVIYKIRFKTTPYNNYKLL